MLDRGGSVKRLEEYRYFNATDKNGNTCNLLLSPFEVALSQQRIEEYPEVRTWKPDPWASPQPGPTLSNPPRLDPLRVGGVFACVLVVLFLLVTCGCG